MFTAFLFTVSGALVKFCWHSLLDMAMISVFSEYGYFSLF